MAHPQVASVIPGLANPAQVEEAVAWRDIAIPPALWDELRDGGLISAGAPTPDLAGRS
jgi:D-threo-aldose 1-dehydrogenase